MQNNSDGGAASCTHSSCPKRATYGVEASRRRQCCAEHARPWMVNIDHTRYLSFHPIDLSPNTRNTPYTHMIFSSQLRSYRRNKSSRSWNRLNSLRICSSICIDAEMSFICYFATVTLSDKEIIFCMYVSCRRLHYFYMCPPRRR